MTRMIDLAIYALSIAIGIYFAFCIKDYISKYIGHAPGRKHG